MTGGAEVDAGAAVVGSKSVVKDVEGSGTMVVAGAGVVVVAAAVVGTAVV